MMRALTSTPAKSTVSALLKKSPIVAKCKVSLKQLFFFLKKNQPKHNSKPSCLKVINLLLLNANLAASFRILPDPARHLALANPTRQIPNINSIVSRRTPKDQWTTHLNTSFPREKETGLRSIVRAMSVDGRKVGKKKRNWHLYNIHFHSINYLRR